MDNHTYTNGDLTWDVKDLWEAARGLKPSFVPIEEIVDTNELLNSHTWSAGRMSVREILGHADRVDKADLSYPIILTPEGHIGDGCHRLVRLWKEGKSHALVVRLEKMPTPIKGRVEGPWEQSELRVTPLYAKEGWLAATFRSDSESKPFKLAVGLQQAKELSESCHKQVDIEARFVRDGNGHIESGVVLKVHQLSKGDAFEEWLEWFRINTLV